MAIPTDPRQVEDLLKNPELVRQGKHDPLVWLHEVSRSIFNDMFRDAMRARTKRDEVWDVWQDVSGDGRPGVRPADQAADSKGKP